MFMGDIDWFRTLISPLIFLLFRVNPRFIAVEFIKRYFFSIFVHNDTKNASNVFHLCVKFLFVCFLDETS